MSNQREKHDKGKVRAYRLCGLQRCPRDQQLRVLRTQAVPYVIQRENLNSERDMPDYNGRRQEYRKKDDSDQHKPTTPE